VQQRGDGYREKKRTPVHDRFLEVRRKVAEVPRARLPELPAQFSQAAARHHTPAALQPVRERNQRG
jgi:hypothetical protein